MANNTILNLGSGGDTIASEDQAGVKYQINKIAYGTAGTQTLAAPTAPFPVGAYDIAVAATNITTQNLTPTAGATAGSAVLSGVLNGQTMASIQVTAAATVGPLSIQGTLDTSGTANWVTIGGLVFTNVNTGAQTATIPVSTTGIFQVDCAGFIQYRVTALSAVTGTWTVIMRSTTAPGLVGFDMSLPAGTAILGKTGIDQTTPGTTNLVALTAETTKVIGTINLAGKISANAPARNDYTSVSVTTAAYTQLVASTTSACTEVEVFDSSGQTLIFATGAAASEVIKFNIFPGGNGRVVLAIPAGTRIAIKALSATASVGEINVNFWG